MKRLYAHFFLASICCVLVSPISLGGGIGVDTPQSPISIDTESHSTNELAELSHLLSGLMTLSTDFEQTLYSQDNDVLQITTGRLQAARPGKVRWQTMPPMEQLVVSDSETLWIYDPDLEQVTIRAFNDDLSKTPTALFIGNLDNLGQSYRVTKEEVDREHLKFILVPVSTDSLYKQVSLGFNESTPESMTLWDSLGQKTDIIFMGVQLNQPIDSDLFNFEPPEGVDIIHNE
jgi:outer membrane lipoprotein carrier protein